MKVYCITLDSPDIFPGGVVTGHVLLETKPHERIKARGVRLSLFGEEKVAVARKDRDDKGKVKTKEYTAERELVNEQVTLFGLPEGSDGDPVFLEPGRQYSFPFKFNLPRHCVPSCEFNDEKRISYRFDSWVDRPWTINFKCVAPLQVLPDAHVRSAPPYYSTELEQRLTPTACFCFGRGSAKIRLVLSKVAYWWQEEVPVQVVVDNSECISPIRRLQVALLIVSAYVAEQQVDTHEHTLVLKEFILSKGGIHPHADEINFHHTFHQDQYWYDTRFPTSTIRGELVTHKFVVRATANYSFQKYSVQLPIYVADGPSRPSSPKRKPVDDGDDVGDDTPPTDGSICVIDPGYYPDSPTEDPGQVFCQTPSGKWPDDGSPSFERTG